MLLPSKHVSEAQALIVVAAQILIVLERPRTITSCVEATRRWRADNGESVELPFWWYVLALDVLYAFGVIELSDQLLRKVENARAS
jgi:hypothetical protein